MASADILSPFQPSEENLPIDGLQPISGDAELFPEAFPASTSYPATTSTPDLSFSTTTIIAQIVNASVFGENVNGTQKIDLQVCRKNSHS
jgi:hypothetical protein